MKLYKYLIFILALSLPSFFLNAQSLPARPVSYRIFAPVIFNPAMAGNKDFTSLIGGISWKDGFSSQLFSGEGRLYKKSPDYVFSEERKQFSSFGLSTMFFHEAQENSKSLGGGFGLSYHIPLNKQNLSFLSFGASAKGIMNRIEPNIPADTSGLESAKESFFPDFDFGIYYYGKRFNTGISVNNILGNHGEKDNTGQYLIPVSRQYYFMAGYKIMLLKSINMIVEPSLIVEFDDFSLLDHTSVYKPLLKLYLEDFCLGMYFDDKDMTSFFFQYRYPGLYLGAYFGLMKKSTYTVNNPLVEIMAGINLSRKRFRVSRSSHW